MTEDDWNGAIAISVCKPHPCRSCKNPPLRSHDIDSSLNFTVSGQKSYFPRSMLLQLIAELKIYPYTWSSSSKIGRRLARGVVPVKVVTRVNFVCRTCAGHPDASGIVIAALVT
eukprot:1328326-Amorphochlora_amoeboformis.AAC.2